ncbi:MAG: imidazole glycerol phosphate synthase subunit HisH [Eubacteriales bacterium]|jgi:glutamine amidotransferase
MIAIIDYGAGNLFNAQKAMEALGYDAVVTGDPQTIRDASKLILPGVGAFPSAMEQLNQSGLAQLLREQVQGGKSLLGICLGMQLLFDRSEEVTPTPGLGLIQGCVKRLTKAPKIPHMGWNDLHFPQSHPVFSGIDEGAYVYFVHSFCAQEVRPEDLIATTEYGETITAAVARDNVIGMQYHPEKSSAVGLRMLRNFAEMK